MNLELQQAYGAKLWKVKAAVLDGLNAQYAHTVAATRAAAEATNVQRKQEQVLNAPKLQTYRRKYLDLLDKAHAIKVRHGTLLTERLVPKMAMLTCSSWYQRACETQERRLQKKVRAE